MSATSRTTTIITHIFTPSFNPLFRIKKIIDAAEKLHDANSTPALHHSNIFLMNLLESWITLFIS
ncbi:hypothetical protein C9397_11725 [Xanthomonas vasicola pv. vasculorum]|uniref:Uncharacterized protein n=1 Tax=Xanthomonas vasicola pv. vasculorum NCPPB 890 TaxID=1184265 RepID=A0A836P3Y9_XANVA|nr:hypothetical protein A11M_0122415 [Xanthomonas vasicola pv. vasculorum NCPPB 895]PUE67827.1 hypothetical protein C7Y63_22510 [Xanthomonas vasicola pv. vasculorum]PUE71846.1 hypothetical protein C7Y61_22555 [Xanthomonas vasicola pv. vasculorum]PUE80058.1 hypothetical protein C7Y64_22485 [Xanthomonas vasicola pv. vasculorum]RNK42940.1 hypothetical protein C9395_10720 [Xanthomonas vasicola pv. vasculorum]